ncbi:pinopsin [Anabrus simplex]|uniref:pinopsin n=1 Tax=Anabrus simplex TaxID=316456 RepID=UPI0035A31CF7
MPRQEMGGLEGVPSASGTGGSHKDSCLLWTPINLVLFNLVMSDFSVSVLGNPLTLAAAIMRRWIFGRAMCVIYGFFMSLLGIASITTLMVLSFERYVMISRPFHTSHLSRKGALLMVAAIWLYSLMLTVPPLVGWGDYVPEAAGISCSVNWESRDMNATTYVVFLFAMGLVVPVGVICFSYLNIIRTMKKNTLQMGRVMRAESRVTFMIGVMIVAFLVAWTPYSVLALLIAFGDADQVSPGLAVVPALVAKSSICYNPLIYVGLNTQFRSAWRRLLGVKLSAESSQDMGAENTFVSPLRNISQVNNLITNVAPEEVGKSPMLRLKPVPDRFHKFEIPSKFSETTECSNLEAENSKVNKKDIAEGKCAPIANQSVSLLTVIPDMFRNSSRRKTERVEIRTVIASKEKIELSEFKTNVEQIDGNGK